VIRAWRLSDQHEATLFMRTVHSDHQIFASIKGERSGEKEPTARRMGAGKPSMRASWSQLRPDPISPSHSSLPSLPLLSPCEEIWMLTSLELKRVGLG
jgi:hypothetical protein